MQRIQIIDSHTGGEPTRLVVDGFPDLGTGSMVERRALLAAEHDRWRTATVLEPRGNDVIVGALLCPPVDARNAAGVVFFNNSGYLGMCGHGTIGLVASLAHMGRIQPGVHGIETPVGTVQTTLHEDGSVSVRNVPAHRLHHQMTLQVPGYGPVTGDVAWGGNWFFLMTKHQQRVESKNLAALTAFALAVQQALADQGVRGSDGGLIDHIELFADDAEADSRNFVLCPGGAYDRSPCGTGTSAKLACLAADGKLQPGQVWRQASIIGSQFEASYAMEGEQLIPTLRGRAFMSAEATLLIEPGDPFGWGIQL
ncbi:4-hydroxyproline epimerase [Simplicispira suum]|uniref:4-hydroxyproline epimerase n=1 Tax=Simplicispira suum TaxID=2109915 RepID=A0A2S0N2Q7_9BURK|nr:4-hydroxyproline epimerase [Simplicispira suum]AVO42415.1 4-hydroxyproline epimerase [Simplicispira suum]MBW7831790.1 4-hydroxyproline epimerase [Simplicispira suum]